MCRKTLLALASSLFTWFHINAQAVQSVYRFTDQKINDLVHTKLDLHFDYANQYVYGKAWLTLHPHFYPTDSLRLDAKGMDLKQISMIKQGRALPLKFTYDSLTATIRLDKMYKQDERYTIFVDYTAKPALLNQKNGNQGLYFINPDGKEKGLPTQIWTTGEPEYNSSWFPCIDKPNQKTTQEISLTVPQNYVTLSNGLLAVQQKHPNGTRTDTWKMDLPHSPYLFMIAVGDFTITRDRWKGKEVSYYLEPQYAANARAIFGDTPEAMSFISSLLGVEYPWSKYAQIRVRGFNGGMENTSATTYNENGQSSPEELADRGYESGNVHELFHQWFGDYVTQENWGNLALSESFADLGELLWAEHKFGQDVADDHLYKGMQSYLQNAVRWKEALIRFDYVHEQDMFDVVTYQKGGRILNMLRHHVGNAAFYKGLHAYLTTYAFKNADGQALRLALEAACGRDLNWFFQQWFYGSGHPVLHITYQWDEVNKIQTVYLTQTQDGNAFILPFAVDLYSDGKKRRYQCWMRGKTDTLRFAAAAKPALVNVDAEKILILQKTDDKPLEAFADQYTHAGLYLDRLEAIQAAADDQQKMAAQQILVAALKDPYYGLRIKAIEAVNLTNETTRSVFLPGLIDLVRQEKNNLARAGAIIQLGKLKRLEDLPLFNQALIGSSSYVVRGAALQAMNNLSAPEVSLQWAKKMESSSKGELRRAILSIYCQHGGVAEWPYVYANFAEAGSLLRYTFTGMFADFAARVQNPVYARQGIDAIVSLVIDLHKRTNLAVFITRLDEIKAGRLTVGDLESANAADIAIRKLKSIH